MPCLRKIGYALAVMFALSLAIGKVFAQSATSQVSGVVTDVSGTIVGGADVTMQNVDTSTIRTATTDEKEQYNVPSLEIGPYRLSVKKPGFASYVQNGIVLEVNNSPSIAVMLKIGSVTEQVEITANAAMVEMQNYASVPVS